MVDLVLEHARLEPRGLDSSGSPCDVEAATRAYSGRSTSTAIPGRLRQPSSAVAELLGEPLELAG